MTLALPRKKYRVILADPAWRTETYTKDRAGTPRRIEGDHYATMSLEELKALDVPGIADKECALFMWVIDTHVQQAIELASSWGFRYSSVAFVWRKMTKNGKDHFGMGKTTRKQLEMVLLFMKTPPKRQSAAVRQYLPAEWIDAKTREHSRKPDEIYSRIEALYEGPRVELFARQKWPGWDSWGAEVGKFPARVHDDLADLLGTRKAVKQVYDDLKDLLG